MKYNYVYLNSSYLVKDRLDPDEYNSICLRDVMNHEEVQVIQSPLDYASRRIRRLFTITNNLRKKRILIL